MAEWKKLRKLLLEQGVTGDEIAATLEAIDNRTRTLKPLEKRASLEAMYDNTLERLRSDERYADRTEEEIERAAGQYFRNTVKMGATPRGRALMEKLGALEATEFALDYKTLEEAADAAGIEADVIETQIRPLRESSPEDVAAGRPVPPSPSFAGAGRRGIRSATPTAPWAGETVPMGRVRTQAPDPATFTIMEQRGFTRPSPPMAPVISDEQAERDFFASPDTPLAYSPAGPAAPTAEMRRQAVRERALAALAAEREQPAAEDEVSALMPPSRMEIGEIEIAGPGGAPQASLDDLPLPDATMDPEAGMPGEPAPASNVMRLGDTAYVRGDDGEWQAVPAMGGAAERGQAALSADIDAWPNPQDPENARRIAEQAMARSQMPGWGKYGTMEGQLPAAGGPTQMVKQAQADNAAAQQDTDAAEMAADPASPGQGWSNNEIAGMIVGGTGLAAAIGNTIADFRTTRSLEKQLAASAAGDTIARREGALGASRAQRNIMATSLGRRDISPALALRNAQMTGSRAMSDIYGRAAIESARERRESEAKLAEMRKKRWNTLFSGLTQAGATVGSFLAAEGAAETGAATRGAGGGNAGT